MRENLESFRNLSYSKFKERALDQSLAPIEKIGFPLSYRSEREILIFKDILEKLPRLRSTHQKILDIGCGCSDLPKLLAAHAVKQSHELWLIDSPEMLSTLGALDSRIQKRPGHFPSEVSDWISQQSGRFDTILVYSLFHYIRADGIQEAFLSACLQLLSAEGELLLGDLPNHSMKIRFLNSAEGKIFHQQNYGSQAALDLANLKTEEGSLNDESIQELRLWFKERNCETSLLTQPRELPFSNRRQDLWVKKRV